MRKFAAGLAAASLSLLAVVGQTTAASAGAGNVHFTQIHYYDPHCTAATNTCINKEYVVIKNGRARAVRMRGWTIKDRRTVASGGTLKFTFPRYRLRPGKTVVVHTGKGINGQPNHNDLYWGLSDFTWNNGASGDAAYLFNKAGTQVDLCTYTGGGTVAYC